MVDKKRDSDKLQPKYCVSSPKANQLRYDRRRPGCVKHINKQLLKWGEDPIEVVPDVTFNLPMLTTKLKTYSHENAPQDSISIAYGGEDNVIPTVRLIERKGSRICSVMIDGKQYFVLYSEYVNLLRTLIRVKAS